MDTLDQENTWAGTELKVTRPDPWTSPKSVPPIVTAIPTGPEADESIEIVGVAGSTVRVAFPLMPPNLATIVALPTPIVVPRPGVIPLMVAIVELDELQFAAAVRSFVLP